MARPGSGTASRACAARGSIVHAHTKHARMGSAVLCSRLPARLGATVGAAAATATATATTVRFLRPRLVDLHRSATERLLMKLLDGHLRLRVGTHLDEREPPPLAR